MPILRRFGLLAAFLAALTFVWFLDAEPRDPRVDQRLETAAARRQRLAEMLDHKVRVDAHQEPVGKVIERWCAAAGVEAEVEPLPQVATLSLPHPVPLRSALALLAPGVALSFDGDRLRVTQQSPTSRVLRVHPVHVARRESHIVTRPPEPALQTVRIYERGRGSRAEPAHFAPTIDIAQPDEPDLWGLSSVHRLTPERLLVSLSPDPADPQGDLLAALGAVADAELAEPAHLGETPAARTRRLRLEAILRQPLTVDFTGSQREAVAYLQTRIEANLVVDHAAHEDQGDALNDSVTLSGRMPAGSALELAVRRAGFTPSIQHDVVRLGSVSDLHHTFAARVYPIGHLFRVGDDWRLQDLFEVLLEIGPAPWNRGDTLGSPPLAAWAGGLAARLSLAEHARLARLLDMIWQVRNPGRIVARGSERLAFTGADLATRLAQPATAAPPTKTLEEFTERLATLLHAPVFFDGGRGERGFAESLVAGGDPGGGTLEEQLERMLTAEFAAVVEEHALRIVVGSPSRSDLSLELHPTPTSGLGAFVPHVPKERHGPLVEAAFSEVLLPDTRSRAHVPGGLLVRGTPAEHRSFRRLLAGRHPFYRTLVGYLNSSRAGQRKLTDEALAGDDPRLVALGVWLNRSDPSGLQPALVQALRSGVLLKRERFQESSASSSPDAVAELWTRLANAGLPARELRGILGDLNKLSPPSTRFVRVLERACQHPNLELARTAYEILGALPARVEREGGECELNIRWLPPARAELEATARAAIEAHARWRVAKTGNLRAAVESTVEWLLYAEEHAPSIRDILKGCVEQLESPGPALWQVDRDLLLMKVYEEMLDEDQPELRQAACRGLLRLDTPAPEVVARLQRLLADPHCAEVLERGLEAWRQAGILLPR